jgi:signal transduction histidine kinase
MTPGGHAGPLDRPALVTPSLDVELGRTAEFVAVQRPPAAVASFRGAVTATLGTWLLLGALLTLVRANSFIASGTPGPWQAAALTTAMYVGVWMLLTPPLLHALLRWAPERPWRSMRTLRRLPLLAGAVTLAAALQVVGYLWLARTVTGTVGLVNLSGPVLDMAGRFEENLVLGALLVIAWMAWRQRQLARWRELQAAYLAAELSASRLQSLGMELRPHFLFNTLNAITGMVWADQATAERMILQLSELLRRTLEAGQSPTSSLREERDVLELYLAIQRIRFGERLRIAVDMPEDTLDAEVPRFLLQPLVENAFQHGLSRQPGEVRLEVVARREGDRLALRVLDDGVGLPADGTVTESTGVGNTRRRLSTLYGASAVLGLHAREGRGAESRVELPWRVHVTLPSSPAPGKPDHARTDR